MPARTISWTIWRFSGLDCAATRERMEKHFNASLIESVASAESLRPVKGSTSGSALTLACKIDPANLV